MRWGDFSHERNKAEKTTVLIHHHGDVFKKQAKELGRGSFGVVRLFVNVNKPDMQIAVKKLRQENSPTSELARQIDSAKSEYVVWKKLYGDDQTGLIVSLGKPNTIRLVFPVILMPSLLWHFQQRKIDSVAKFLSAVYLLINAVIDFHEKTGRAHCDVKVDNVLINFDRDAPRAVLIDFGLAIQFGTRISLQQTSEEKPRLIPPEVFDDVYEVGPSFDAYSVGDCIDDMMNEVGHSCVAPLLRTNALSEHRDAILDIKNRLMSSDRQQRLTLPAAREEVRQLMIKNRACNRMKRLLHDLLSTDRDCEGTRRSIVTEWSSAELAGLMKRALREFRSKRGQLNDAESKRIVEIYHCAQFMPRAFKEKWQNEEACAQPASTLRC